MEHGKKVCDESPTIPEDALHKAIMDAVSEAIMRNTLLDAVTESVRAATYVDTGAEAYQNAKLKIAELNKRANEVVTDSAHARADENAFDEQFKMIMEERAKYQKIVQEFESKDSFDRYTERQVAEAVIVLENESLLLTGYDDQIIRQLVDTIRVLAKDRIIVTLKGGMEIDQRIAV